MLRSWTRADATVTTVVADKVDCGVVDHRRVVPVVNVGDIHVAYRTVVVELPVLPASTLITVTVISVAVTDAAIEADLLAPVAVVENISVAAPTPIGRSSEQSRFGSHDPCAWHPVVTIVVAGVSPVPGCPDVAFAGDQRLLVDGQFRRGE